MNLAASLMYRISSLVTNVNLVLQKPTGLKPQLPKRTTTAEAMDKVFNDNVHGHIRIPPLCVRIMDTPEFQRLRNIKQLGLAYLVYPGASHNRFEHSLGVCHLAGQFVEHLRSNRGTCQAPDITDTERLCVEVAALCHDLGHGPLSHTWERFVNTVRDREQRKHWHHESSSCAMLDALIANNDLRDEFNKYQLFDAEIEFIKQLIEGREIHTVSHPKPFLYQILANKDNDIDVDKWDYFLRDALYLNTSETFDCRRLMASVRLVRVNGMWQVCWRDKDALNVYNMFQVRARLHYQSYQHPVVKNLEIMMTDAWLEADKAGYCIPLPDGTSISLSRAQESTVAWSRVTDHVIYDLTFSLDSALQAARHLLQRISRRELYTLVARCRIESQDAYEDKRSKVAAFCLRDGRFKFSDFRFGQLKLDHGSANKNPFDRVYFYEKHSPDVARTKSIEDIQLFPVTRSDLLRRDLLLFHTSPKKEFTEETLQQIQSLLV